MVSDYLDRQKAPTGKAWVAVCVIALAVVAIVYAAFASDFRVKIKSALEIDIQNGEGASDINVYNIHKGGYGV
jgi:hypothetical protein